MESKPKRGRGRPRKNPLPEEVKIIPEEVKPVPELEEHEEFISIPKLENEVEERFEEETMLPGVKTSNTKLFEEEEQELVLPKNEELENKEETIENIIPSNT